MIALAFPLAQPVHQPSPIGKILDHAVRSEGFLHKEIAGMCGADPATWSRAVHDLGPMDARWCLGMPWGVLCKFVKGIVLAHVDLWLDHAKESMR